MKKKYFILIIFVFCGLLAFGEVDELDYLLFLPNSSNQFVNNEQAVIQLDKLSKYLMEKKLTKGQIFVYGYAAEVKNDIEPMNLSKDRALFVVNELQKRGVSKEFFSDPVAYGSVELWGNNTNEQERGPNRRVRIMLDGNVLTPSAIKVVEPAPAPAPAPALAPAPARLRPRSRLRRTRTAQASALPPTMTSVASVYRYGLRPPFSLQRLRRLRDWRVCYLLSSETPKSSASLCLCGSIFFRPGSPIVQRVAEEFEYFTH